MASEIEASPRGAAAPGGAAGVAAAIPAAAPGAPKRRSFDRSIVDGPLLPAVWKIAWPTVLQNAIGGVQGIVDHALVGHYVGYTGNAAIGVSWQIFLVVIVFISSLFTGMGVLVARFAGANDDGRGQSHGVPGVHHRAGPVARRARAARIRRSRPRCSTLVNATPAVRAEALPFLRLMFTGSIGLLMFFMLGGALRAAGDARTPLRLGIAMTVLNFCLNVVFISGAGPIPAFGTRGAAMGTVDREHQCVGCRASGCSAPAGSSCTSRRTMSWRPDFTVIRSLFRFGLPAGIQGVAMNVAGVMLLRFIGSLALQRRGAGGVRGRATPNCFR